MKPKDLKSPYRWDGRQVVIKDRVWYVPEYFSDYEGWHFPGWSHPDLFGNDNPVLIEYCSGNGAWVIEKAIADPGKNWVAVEKRFDRVRKIWSKSKNQGIDNLVVVCGEACTTTRYYIPSASVSEIFINFPDPWPKTRHHKKRLMSAAFVEQMSRVLMPGGLFTLVTDDAEYSGVCVKEMSQAPAFEALAPEPFWVSPPETYGSSYFDALWRSKGKIIRYHPFRRR